MKRTRYLWFFMVALLVPALALSSCDNKKRHINDDDSSESSKKIATIEGRYKLDQNGTLAMLGEALPDDGVDYNLKSEVFLEDDNDVLLRVSTVLSAYNEYVETIINMTYETEIRGTWSYDKEQRILSFEMKKGEVTDVDYSFAEHNKKVEEAIESAGGLENMEEAFKNEFSQDDFINNLEFKVTNLRKRGFYARDIYDKAVKVHFKRVD